MLRSFLKSLLMEQGTCGFHGRSNPDDSLLNHSSGHIHWQEKPLVQQLVASFTCVCLWLDVSVLPMVFECIRLLHVRLSLRLYSGLSYLELLEP